MSHEHFPHPEERHPHYPVSPGHRRNKTGALIAYWNRFNSAVNRREPVATRFLTIALALGGIGVNNAVQDMAPAVVRTGVEIVDIFSHDDSQPRPVDPRRPTDLENGY